MAATYQACCCLPGAPWGGKEGKKKKKKRKGRRGEIGGRGMARANLSGKEVAPIAQLQLRFRFCSWLPSGLLLGSQPILTRSYRTMQSARCHPKTNDSVPISPGGLRSSPTSDNLTFSSSFARASFFKRNRNPPPPLLANSEFFPLPSEDENFNHCAMQDISYLC